MTEPAVSGGALAGLVLALTRPRARAARWADVFRKAGAKVLLTPVIETVPPSDTSPLDDALRSMSRYGCYDWTVFTSISSVERVFERLRALRLSPSLFDECSVAAVGRATAASLERNGVRPRIVPKREDAEGLLDAFQIEGLGGLSILMPRAASGRETFPEGARVLGAEVHVVEAYRTVEIPGGVDALHEHLSSGGVDAVVVGSPSQVKALVPRLTGLLSACLVICAGSTTAEEVQRAGLKAYKAPRPDAHAVVSLLGSLRTR